MKKMLKARSICWGVFSDHCVHVSTPKLKANLVSKNKWLKWTVLQPGSLNEVDDQGGDGKDKSDSNLIRKKLKIKLKINAMVYFSSSREGSKAGLTKTLPATLCPDISSPAQSLF